MFKYKKINDQCVQDFELISKKRVELSHELKVEITHQNVKSHIGISKKKEIVYKITPTSYY